MAKRKRERGRERKRVVFDYPRVDERTGVITHARVARRTSARRLSSALRGNGRYFDSTPPCILRSVPPSFVTPLSCLPSPFSFSRRKAKNKKKKEKKRRRKKKERKKKTERFACTQRRARYVRELIVAPRYRGAPLSEPGQSIDVDASFAWESVGCASVWP